MFMDESAYGQQKSIVPPVSIKLHPFEESTVQLHMTYASQLCEGISDFCTDIRMEIAQSQQRSKRGAQYPVVKHVLREFFKLTRNLPASLKGAFGGFTDKNLSANTGKILVNFPVAAIKSPANQPKGALGKQLAEEVMHFFEAPQLIQPD